MPLELFLLKLGLVFFLLQNCLEARAMCSVIGQRPDFHSLTSNEVLDEFVAMRILDKTADNAVLRSQRTKKPNLALKAKASV